MGWKATQWKNCALQMQDKVFHVDADRNIVPDPTNDPDIVAHMRALPEYYQEAPAEAGPAAPAVPVVEEQAPVDVPDAGEPVE